MDVCEILHGGGYDYFHTALVAMQHVGASKDSAVPLNGGPTEQIQRSSDAAQASGIPVGQRLRREMARENPIAVNASGRLLPRVCCAK